jgi:hypothetical protein
MGVGINHTAAKVRKWPWPKSKKGGLYETAFLDNQKAII